MRDAFGREITYLRVSVTDLCNLRCRYCMPETGACKRAREETMSEDETAEVIRAAAKLGVRKIRITGGEPLVKKNIVSICRRAAALPGVGEVCLTTNGTLLSGLAGELRRAGVSRLNVSLDTLEPRKYSQITRGGRLGDALAGIEAARRAGFSRLKINTVLIGGFNDDEIPALAGLTRESDLDLRFIELMPMNRGGGFAPEAYFPCARALERLPGLEPLPGDGVAAMYRYPGARGRVGFISAVSAAFCAACNRLRLTADGCLKPCLHSPLEFPVRGLGAADIEETLKRAVLAKPERHAPLSAECFSRSGRSMNRIGG